MDLGMLAEVAGQMYTADFGAIAAILAAGATIYSTTQQPKPPVAKTKGPPPTPSEGAGPGATKQKQYKPAAQLFEKYPQLGLGGKLGL